MISDDWESVGFSSISIEVALKANFVCEYCGLNFLDSIRNYDQFQIDHIIPKSRTSTNDDGIDCNNLALSCAFCNKIKRNHIPPNKDLRRDQLIDYFSEYIKGQKDKKEQRLAMVVRKYFSSKNAIRGS